MSSLPKRHFWDWFKRHQVQYLSLNKFSKKDATYWVRELNAHLRAYCREFAFSIAVPRDGRARLTITVNGKAKYFKKTETFVALAPAIPGWSIHALEDPVPMDLLLDQEIAAAGIHPFEFYFSFKNNSPGEVDLVIYHSMYIEDKRRVLLELAYGAVYNLLGERSFGMDLRFLEMDNLSVARDEVYPLQELPVLISRRVSDFSVDANGMLISGRK